MFDDSETPPLLDSHVTAFVEDIKSRFVERLPQVRRIASSQFRHLRGDEREDAIAEAVAFAWRGFKTMALEGGDADRMLPSIAFYAAKRVRAGGKIAGAVHVRDAMSRNAENQVTFLPLHRDETAAGEAHDAMRDRGPDPADQAVSNLDYQSMLKTLTPRERSLAELLMEGEYPAQIAKLRGVSNQAVLDQRKTLARKWAAREGYGDPMVR